VQDGLRTPIDGDASELAARSVAEDAWRSQGKFGTPTVNRRTTIRHADQFVEHLMASTF